MERLTERGWNGAVSIDANAVGKVMDRLAEYEDTGMTPEEIEDLFYFCGEEM